MGVGTAAAVAPSRGAIHVFLEETNHDHHDHDYHRADGTDDTRDLAPVDGALGLLMTRHVLVHGGKEPGNAVAAGTVMHVLRRRRGARNVRHNPVVLYAGTNRRAGAVGVV